MTHTADYRGGFNKTSALSMHEHTDRMHVADTIKNDATCTDVAVTLSGAFGSNINI